LNTSNLPIENSLLTELDNALPQTQCTKCGYPDCHAYAKAMSQGEALHNRCPPGGSEGIVRLAKILKQPILSLDEPHGLERPRPLAVIDEKECIGCTLCIKACPVDAIIGAPKKLHFVINDRCTGCDLCVAPCPVDCIEMVPVTEKLTGWEAWSNEQANFAKHNYEAHKSRQAREERDLLIRQSNKAASKLAAFSSENDTAEKARKKAIIEAAMARAKQKLSEF
jgi:electron transport complex protein RnfB